jgi:hypothetical protein
MWLSDALPMQLKKTFHPALDLSHSNPDFCHPKNAGKKSSVPQEFREEPETLGKDLHAASSFDR